MDRTEKKQQQSFRFSCRETNSFNMDLKTKCLQSHVFPLTIESPQMLSLNMRRKNENTLKETRKYTFFTHAICSVSQKNVKTIAFIHAKIQTRRKF